MNSPATVAETPGPGQPDVHTIAQVAQQAAALAVQAADTAMHAVIRSTAANSSRLDSIMFAAHEAATEAERFARMAVTDAQTGEQGTCHAFAVRAIAYAAQAQQMVGVDRSAAALTKQIERARTEEDRREAERAERESAAVYEAEMRAKTGMDADNRLRLEIARLNAEEVVPTMGWSTGMVRAMEIAQAGRLYRRDGFMRDGGVPGRWTGGRRVSRERVRMLAAAGFLVIGRGEDRKITPTPMGEAALYLAHLHPQGVHPDDKSAHAARLAACRSRWRRRDETKAAARKLPPLDRFTLRRVKRPVTLAEQEARAAGQASQTWEDDGGAIPAAECCPPGAAAPSSTLSDRRPFQVPYEQLAVGNPAATGEPLTTT